MIKDIIKEENLLIKEENKEFWKRFFGNLFKKQTTQKEIDEIIRRAVSKSWREEFMRK